ncbi:hypothetical protein [Caulobacter sp. DWR3-1-2]|uniref:hypothetical protein n=1 Tax=Caulobacter sp. DWR3-1-2 TaxID=2804647 RepID=UPI003CF49CE2
MKLVRSHLSWLESESIHILREAVAEARNPVMLFSAGKDSTVMAHLALRAFYPSIATVPMAACRLDQGVQIADRLP